MKKYILPLAVLFFVLLTGCTKKSDCGASSSESLQVYSNEYFLIPANIYWGGAAGGFRAYTYNWTVGNICPKRNPEVDFSVQLDQPNNNLPTPFTVTAGINTCLGLAQQGVTMVPSGSNFFSQNTSDVGMQQCYSGLDSATIYPFITIKFPTLGNDHDDSLYFVQHVTYINTRVDFNKAK